MRNILKFHRLRRGWSIRGLSQIAGVAVERIEWYEEGKHGARAETAIRLAKALQVPVDQLFLLEPYIEFEIIKRRDAYVPKKNAGQVRRRKGKVLDKDKRLGLQIAAKRHK